MKGELQKGCPLCRAGVNGNYFILPSEADLGQRSGTRSRAHRQINQIIEQSNSQWKCTLELSPSHICYQNLQRKQVSFWSCEHPGVLGLSQRGLLLIVLPLSLSTTKRLASIFRSILSFQYKKRKQCYQCNQFSRSWKELNSSWCNTIYKSKRLLWVEFHSLAYPYEIKSHYRNSFPKGTQSLTPSTLSTASAINSTSVDPSTCAKALCFQGVSLLEILASNLIAGLRLIF